LAFNNLQYTLENLSMKFHGGVRRTVLIFIGICLIILIPFYFLGQATATFWLNNKANQAKIEYRNLQNPKSTNIYNYQINRSQQVPLIGNETVLYTTINNQDNPNIGYNPLAYTVQVLDMEGKIIFSQRQQSYLLPGEVMYVVASPETPNGYEIKLIKEPQTNPILFNPFANNFANILEEIEIRNPLVNELDDNNLELSGIIKNNSLIEIRELEVLYIIRGNRDRVIGIGQRIITNLLPGEERQFFATYPKSKYRTPRSLDLRVRVNYLDDTNFIVK
jgi:hypothetical protein